MTDPVAVLGAVDSPDAGTRVRELLHLLEHGGLGIDPVYSLAGGTSPPGPAYRAPSATATSSTACEMALLGPFVHVPEVLAHRTFEAVSSIGLTRNFLQREHAILCVARSASSLTAHRARACASPWSASRRESTLTASAGAPAHYGPGWREHRPG